jgi:RNA-directed DNA polymerase
VKNETLSSISCSLYAAKVIDDEALFSRLFSPEELKAVFDASFATSTGKGTDRLNGFQFAIQSSAELAIASKKCLNAQYRFSPFMETLKPKGRDKFPRLIGVPTIRDRVVLHQLNKFLAAVYPDRVPRNVASTYVRSIAANLRSKASDDVWVCSTDIRNFYDSIQQSRLSRVLRKSIKFWPALRLIEHALVTPTVPKNTQRSRHAEYRLGKGVPQGLAISNILASIYMDDVDKPMLNLPVSYYRYVDDVLIFGSEDAVHQALATFRSRLKYRGLSLHGVSSGKTHVAPLSESFGYLGYTFRWPVITVRDATVERFLQSIAAKFSDYTHNKARRLERFKYLNEERVANIFLLELNERLTGAISGKKRYGWIAYFNQITDLSLLHRLDKTIAGMFSRISEFGGTAPSGLRKLARAYFEMKFNPEGGYVRNYDKILTATEKVQFLLERGRVGPDETLTDDQISDRYDKYLSHILSAMHSDEGQVYS